MNPIQFLVEIMLHVLKLFYSFSGSYGLSIIFLTIAVKIILYPLTLQSTQQMNALQKIQPKIAELQKKLKDQPEKMQKELIELYQKHGVNPLGGCLPLLLQLPVFIALFFTLTSPEFLSLVNQPGVRPGFLWLTSLAAPDQTYILVLLIGVTTYLTQKMMSQPSTPQTGMMVFMPIFIAFISLTFPSGVQLYWVVQNLLTMAQQAYILNKMR